MIRILFDYFTISAVAANRQLSFGFAALFNFSTPGQYRQAYRGEARALMSFTENSTGFFGGRGIAMRMDASPIVEDA